MTAENSESEVFVIKRKKKRKVEGVKAALKEEFPNCFKSGDEKLPLKIGIHLQLHFHYKDDPRFDPQELQKGLNAYASSPKYLAKIVEGAVRVDIYGNPVAHVTAEEAADAQKKLKIREELLQQSLLAKQQKLAAHEELMAQRRALKQKKCSSQKKEEIPVVAEVPKTRLVLTLSTTPDKKNKPAASTVMLTKEEIKKANQERYAKKLARRKS